MLIGVYSFADFCWTNNFKSKAFKDGFLWLNGWYLGHDEVNGILVILLV